MSKIKALYQKYKEIILYLIFGGLTTLVSFVSFWLCDLIFGVDLVTLSEIISWVLSVAFAYVVNKLFVFESKSWAFKVVKKEIPPFVFARVFSLLVELGGILLLVHPLKFKDISFELFGFVITGQVLAKLILSVVVVIMNYFFSKFIIFKKKKPEAEINEPTSVSEETTSEAQESKEDEK